jgi:fibronectin-binding autotransporter adhesin
MKLKSLLLSCLLVAGAFRAEAQFFYWNTAVTNGLWNDTANWEEGIVPNEVDAVVFFDNTVNTVVNLNGFTATVGELNFANTVTIGSTTSNDDIINLDSTAGQPRISVAANNAFMYGELTGTNGFRKEGPARFSFRFNPNDQNYSGNITLAGGILGINQDGSLGNTNNDIIAEATSTLQIEPGNNTNAVTLGTGRDISIASGATLTINNGGAAVVGTVNGVVSGDGNLTFGGTGSLILNGTNTYTGATVINGPGFGGSATNTNIVSRSNLVSFANLGSIPTGTALTATFGSASAINSSSTMNINLGGNALTPTLFAPTFSGVATNSTSSTLAMVITNGSLNYTTVDTFAVNTRGVGLVNADLTLPEITSISAAAFNLGTAGSSSFNPNRVFVRVGAQTTLNGNSFTLGAYRAAGSILARADGSSLTMRGSDGTSPVQSLLIGNYSGGNAGLLVSTINLSNSTLDLAANEIIVGRNVANASGATASLQFGAGTVTAPTLVISYPGTTNQANTTATSFTNVITGFVTQNGGSATFSNIVLGRTGEITNPLYTFFDNYVATYNLAGGTLRAASIATGSTNAALTGNSRTVFWTGGTLRNYDAATDLNITASTAPFSAIGLTIGGTNTKTLTIDAGRTATLSSGVAVAVNGGTLVFDAAADSTLNAQGRFRIGTATTDPAAVQITNGTANFSTASGTFAIGDRAAGESALNVSGGTVNIVLSTSRLLVGNQSPGAINVSGGSLNVTGDQAIYVGGDISFGATGAAGTWNVSGGSVNIGGTGAFVLGQNSATTIVTNTNGVITNVFSNAIGTLDLNGGTFTTTRALTTGVNTNGTESTGVITFNGGTLAAGGDVANLINVTTATVSANSTFDTGGFDSGIGQNLAGTGTLTVIGSGTLRLNGTNTPPVVVASSATLGGTGAVGDLTVNGTLAPGTADADGLFTATGSLSVPGTARFRVFGNGVNDRLLASGGASLGGTVAVTIDDEYTPASGDTFDLVDGAISGTPVLSLPTLGTGLVWVTNNFISTGVLSITNGDAPTNNYANWISNYPTLTGPDALGTADPDGDGFDNNLEYAFDGNPTVGTPALMTVTPAGTNAVFNWVERKNPPGGVTYAVQKSTALTNGWTAATGLTISNSLNQAGILIPADYERKEFILPASGKDFYRVQGTIND